MRRLVNLLTRIDEGMTTRRDTYLVMYAIILTALVSLGLGTGIGYWMGYLVVMKRSPYSPREIGLHLGWLYIPDLKEIEHE